MKSFLSVVLVGVVFVLLYDSIGALISRSTGFAYGWLAIGSLALYAVFGFLAGRKSGWAYGLAGGAFLGLIDSTIGWTISWMIGPGKPSTEMNAVMILVTVIFVTISAGVFGLIGGLTSLLGKRDA
ncbi:MAG TPA: hypothetical protein VGQ55_15815 [Pyrinomonadaceae bacterium]|jgi:hypothetical protein|nr:hypothetical protein [Pyrinomonadaceae bacterium]